MKRSDFLAILIAPFILKRINRITVQDISGPSGILSFYNVPSTKLSDYEVATFNISNADKAFIDKMEVDVAEVKRLFLKAFNANP